MIARHKIKEHLSVCVCVCVEREIQIIVFGLFNFVFVCKEHLCERKVCWCTCEFVGERLKERRFVTVPDDQKTRQ